MLAALEEAATFFLPRIRKKATRVKSTLMTLPLIFWSCPLAKSKWKPEGTGDIHTDQPTEAESRVEG